jgi:RNA recognition motif-containing protein
METILAEETLGLTKLNQETNQSNFFNNHMNIYVGNIPWGVSEEELEGLFGQYGEVNSVRIITDRESGRSKGFGFVEMAQADAGNAAIEALDGNDFSGRDLRVNQAKERT